MDHWILLRRNLPLLQLDHFRRLAEPGQFLSDFVQFFSRCQDELVSPDDYQRYARRAGEEFHRVRGAMAEDERASARRKSPAAGDRPGLPRQRPAVARTQAADLRHADHGCRRALRRRCRAARFALRALPLHSGGRVPGHQHRAARIAVAARRQTAPTWSWSATIARPSTVFAARRSAASRFFSTDLPRDLPTRTGTCSGRSRSITVRPGEFCASPGKPSATTRSREIFRECPLTAVREDGGKVRIVTHPAGDAEAQWMAGEIDRLHLAGAKWRSFAVLYRGHAHRDKLVDVLKARKIPFVIKNLSILSHRLVRDLIAYLRLIARPTMTWLARACWLCRPGASSPPIWCACWSARRNQGRSLWDTMQASHAEPPFSEGGRRLGELIGMIAGLRKKSRPAHGHGTIRRACRSPGDRNSRGGRKTANISTASRNSSASGSPRAKRSASRNLSSTWIISSRPADRSIWSRSPATPCN